MPDLHMDAVLRVPDFLGTILSALVGQIIGHLNIAVRQIRDPGLGLQCLTVYRIGQVLVGASAALAPKVPILIDPFNGLLPVGFVRLGSPGEIIGLGRLFAVNGVFFLTLAGNHDAALGMPKQSLSKYLHGVILLARVENGVIARPPDIGKLKIAALVRPLVVKVLTCHIRQALNGLPPLRLCGHVLNHELVKDPIGVVGVPAAQGHLRQHRPGAALDNGALVSRDLVLNILVASHKCPCHRDLLRNGHILSVDGIPRGCDTPAGRAVCAEP